MLPECQSASSAPSVLIRDSDECFCESKVQISKVNNPRPPCPPRLPRFRQSPLFQITYKRRGIKRFFVTAPYLEKGNVGIETVFSASSVSSAPSAIQTVSTIQTIIRDRKIGVLLLRSENKWMATCVILANMKIQLDDTKVNIYEIHI